MEVTEWRPEDMIGPENILRLFTYKFYQKYKYRRGDLVGLAVKLRKGELVGLAVKLRKGDLVGLEGNLWVLREQKESQK